MLRLIGTAYKCTNSVRYLLAIVAMPIDRAHHAYALDQGSNWPSIRR